jgi:hypothetical protein
VIREELTLASDPGTFYHFHHANRIFVDKTPSKPLTIEAFLYETGT